MTKPRSSRQINTPVFNHQGAGKHEPGELLVVVAPMVVYLNSVAAEQDIASTSDLAYSEKAEVDQELDRLTRCVHAFQQKIAQVSRMVGRTLYL